MGAGEGLGLTGRVVLVTGGAGGIGAACARRAEREGARVALWDRDATGLARVVATLADPAAALAQPVDVTSTESVEAAVVRLEARFGRVDVLVHAAGVLSTADLSSCSDAEWERTVTVNLTGTFRVLRAVVPAMARTGGGSVVLLASAAAFSPATPTGIAYVASKAAVLGMMRQLAYRYTAQGVRVNAVAPGFVDSDMPRSAFPPGRLADAVAHLPMRRMATPDEIADAALFLGSPRAAYVQGATLDVTGGSAIR